MPSAVKSRRMVIEGADVFVKETTMAAGESLSFHYHSTVLDIFYCLQGELSIEQADVFTGESLPPIQLLAGESATIRPGIAHRPHNSTDQDTRFLLIQGVGEYDYILYNAV